MGALELISALVIAGAIPGAIIVICVLWMRSTRASQRRVEAQNQRIIELLEEIAGGLRRPDSSAGDSERP
ncbi:MAG: hypothetical protein JWO56_196 [Acidobacteria bacterium]|nr:hypothetical protein [Acidobacteriota bacterium]